MEILNAVRNFVGWVAKEMAFWYLFQQDIELQTKLINNQWFQ